MQKILLLNKKDLIIAKTISLNFSNLGYLKLSDEIISIFLIKDKKLSFINYDILSDGIKWETKSKGELIDVDNYSTYNFCKNNNYILFINYNGCNLFEIKEK